MTPEHLLMVARFLKLRLMWELNGGHRGRPCPFDAWANYVLGPAPNSWQN